MLAHNHEHGQATVPDEVRSRMNVARARTTAARLLGVQVYSIRRLTRRGVLPYKKIGNKWLIHYGSLKKFASETAA
jgi:excisionase family DNA binding protein